MENMKTNSFGVEIKYSKTDLPVPVINHVHLHSIYNPEREAENFVTANDAVISKGKDLLVFGLGFGYHIAKLEEALKVRYPNTYRVFVIEPNNALVEKWKSLRPTMLTPRVKVVSYGDVKEFYKDRELVEFLSEKPSILPHPASFQLNEDFFRGFMSYHYPTSLSESLAFVQNIEMRNYLEQGDTNETTDEFFNTIKNKPFLHGRDFLTMALSEMVQGKQR